jgi:Methyltransferase domain
MTEPIQTEPATDALEAVLASVAPAELAAAAARMLTSYSGGQRLYEACFDVLEAHGVHVTPVHRYGPVPDTRELTPEVWSRPPEPPGLDMNRSGQLDLLGKLAQYGEELEALQRSAAGAGIDEALVRGSFGGTDAFVYYSMIRHFRPARVTEIGGGFSSRLAAHAAQVNGGTELVCVDIEPDESLTVDFPGPTRIVAARVQDLDAATFDALGENDILFIDSSHVVRTGGDVNYLFLDVLPRLRPGVIVHVHDVFLPHDYPMEWVLFDHRFWSEQYLLQAFLAFNAEYEVLLANSYLDTIAPAALRRAFPASPWWGGGSFWIRRIVR